MRAFRLAGGIVQLSVLLAAPWLFWLFWLHLVKPLCDAAWPISMTAVICGKAPTFLYAALGIGALEAACVTLILAPFLIRQARP